MSRNETVFNAIWGEPKFASLGSDGKLLYLWSFTNSHVNMAGLYEIAERTITFETGLNAKRLRAALAELSDFKMLFYAHDGLLWCRARAKRLPFKSPNVAKSIARDVGHVDAKHPLRVAFLRYYGDVSWLRDALAGLTIPFDEIPTPEPKTEGVSRGLGDPLEGVHNKNNNQIGEEKTTSKVEVDEVPTNIAPVLLPFVEPVHAALARIAAVKQGAVAPTKAAVARTLARFPDRDFLPAAEDMEHWLLDGTGRNRSVKDVVQTYANQLRRQPPVARKTQPGGGRTTVDLTERRLRESRGECVRCGAPLDEHDRCPSCKGAA